MQRRAGLKKNIGRYVICSFHVVYLLLALFHEIDQCQMNHRSVDVDFNTVS